MGNLLLIFFLFGGIILVLGGILATRTKRINVGLGQREATGDTATKFALAHIGLGALLVYNCGGVLLGWVSADTAIVAIGLVLIAFFILSLIGFYVTRDK